MAQVIPREEKSLRTKFDELIRDVERLFEESQIHKERSRPENNALGNLVAVANTAACLKQVELFLQYQAARDHRKWEEGHRFASNLIKRMVPGGIVDKSVAAAVKEIGAGEDRAEEMRVWLATQYLGFVRRKYQYLATFERGKP